jgi:lipoprotein-releasing system permease protein
MFDSVSTLLGLRYTLGRQRSRSVAFISRIAMVGIILGVSLLIVVLSVMNGFDKELRERILRIMPQVTVYHAQGLSDWSSLRQQLLNHEKITAVSPFVELQGMINVAKKTEPLLIYGVDPELELSTSILHQFLPPKTLPTLAQDQRLIVLGRGLAENIDVKKGDTVSIIIPRAEGKSQAAVVRRLQVLALLDTGTEVDTSLAIMGIEAAAALSVFPASVSGLHIKVDDLFLAASVAQDLQAQLPYGFYTTDWTRTHGNIYYAIQMSKNLVSLLLLLIIAIAAFNVVSTLVMAVIDKQSDIAILKTLGASKRQIVAVFMIQGTVISIIGTLLGVLLGVLLAIFITDIVQLIELVFGVHFLKGDIYPVSYLPSNLRWLDVLLVVLVSLAMSFIATLYPAWRAASIQPAETLRYD